MSKSSATQTIVAKSWWRNSLAIMVCAGAVVFCLEQTEQQTQRPTPQAYGFSATGPVVDIRARLEATSNEQSQSAGEIQLASATVEAAEEGSPTAAAATSWPLIGGSALMMHLSMLEQGCEFLAETPGYTATFFKRERIDGEICDGQVMEFKLRHEPFSVYMKWLEGDPGRELLFVDGAHEGKMLVHYGGWKARLLPMLKVDPHGSLALRQSRYPVTNVGILELVRRLITDRKQDLAAAPRVSCQLLDNQFCNERACYYFSLEYEDAKASELYRKSVTYIDKEWSLPICIKNFGWPESAEHTQLAPAQLDDATLLEFYSYANIDMQSPPVDQDFDYQNTKYKFRR